MGLSADIRIEGLRELNKALREVDEALPKEMRSNLKAVADRVASKAAGRVPRRSGKLASSIRGLASQKSASIAEGTARVPYAGSFEFGGWPKGRPYLKEGRVLFPTAQESEDEVVEAVTEAIEGLIRKAGLD